MRIEPVHITVAFGLLLFVATAGNAQVLPNQVTPDNATGRQPYNLYGGVRENVAYSNGNLNLHIPLVSLPGRNGLNLELGLEYDSKVWQLNAEDQIDGSIDYWWKYEKRTPAVGAFGWRLTIPSLDATWVSDTQTSYVVTMADGSKHVFMNSGTDSNDASFMELSGALRMKDGTQIQFAGLASKIVDTNGNSITIQQLTPPGIKVIDTVGREVTIPGAGLNYSTPTGITYKDSNGNPQTLTFTYTSIYIAPTFAKPINQPSFGRYVHPFPPGNYSLLTGITLQNGKTYTITYNTFGEVTKITYPTGGYTRYDYGAYVHRWDNGNPEDITDATFRQLNARYVCRDASGVCGTEDQTTYAPSAPWYWESNQFVDIRNPEGHRTRVEMAQTSFRYAYTGTKVYSIREMRRYEYSGESTLLRTTQTDYTDASPMPWSLPLRVTTTLNDTNQVSKMEWTYDTYTAYVTNYLGQIEAVTRLIDNPLEKREYAFGSGAPGALARKTTYTWLKTGPYLGLHIMDRKLSEKVFDPSDLVTPKTETQYEYDNFTVTPSGAIQLETRSATRGNPTKIRRWRNLPAPATFVETTNTYDDAGSILTTIDPLGHATSFDYTDVWGNQACLPPGSTKAYLTTTTNALLHVTHATYNSCTGTVASTTDANNQTTTFAYDLMDRLTQTNLPGGGQSTRTYNESSTPFSLTTSTKIDGTKNLVSTAVVDGLGRVAQTQLVNPDPSCTLIYSDTAYDSVGRKSTVSNPHCSAALPTDGITTYNYDALGRVTKLIPPDGTAVTNHVLTQYAGNTVTVTDQAGKQRKSYTDALGRLIQVDEPNPTLSTPAVTTYTYDTLDNLTNVLQGGSRPRTFTYNSLSQLLSASNPESGAISYTYDGDGNLLTKTDARGIVAVHSYDALHRLTQKSHNDGTPTATYVYDQDPGWGAQNLVGRLIYHHTDATAVVNSYDAMGRVVTQWHCVPANCSNVHSVGAWYDLAGNLIALNYPGGRKVTYGYNSASQLNRSTFDSFNGTPVNYNYLSSASYAPHGAPSSLTLGNGIVETATYNNRLQPGQLRGASSVLTAFDYLYAFNWGVANNGNVTVINDQLNSGRTQSFSYDELNRLKTAQSAATSGANCWGLNFNYDIWANLYSSNVTKCSAPTLGLTINALNRIADPGFSYDAAGNLTTQPGVTYQYDAENRMKSLNTSGATYTYDAEGNRVRKQVGAEITEYIYFGGQVIAERAANGDWSDYIYAGGRRLARADNYEDRILTYGTNCSNCGWQAAWFGFPNNAGLAGYTIQPGDKLYWRQWQTTGARGGIAFWFTDGSTSHWSTYDQDGQAMNDDGFQQVWHYRRVDLSQHASKSISFFLLVTDSNTAGGWWGIYYQDIVLVSADGTVRPIYSRQKTVSLSVGSSAGMTGVGYEVNHIAPAGQWPTATTAYYHGDHLGSARLTSSENGYPVWQATYLPFGQEWTGTPSAALASPNHFKFTGKERDAESGLDFFIARSYASTLGRFLQPDEFTGGPVDAFSSSDPLPPGPLPYADISNPQSLNKYTYTWNNPLNYVDPNGHDAWEFVYGAVNSLQNNFAGAAPRQELGSDDFKAGQSFGDAVSVVVGVATAIQTATATVGVSLGSVGTLAVVAVPAGVVVTAVAAKGALNGAIHLAEDAHNIKVGDKPYQDTPENTERMKQGNAPKGKDGHSVELHHENQKQGKVKEMTRSDHRLGGNFKKNHPNTGQEPSKINRPRADRDREAYWKAKGAKQQKD